MSALLSSTGGRGAAGADPRICPQSMKQILVASPGTQPEAPGRSLGFGHQQHPKPENRDSQHMLNQHSGFFLIHFQEKRQGKLMVVDQTAKGEQ